jgi:DNA-directed RNA polymerase subunit M/transcription elongation factor TFIIS
MDPWMTNSGRTTSAAASMTIPSTIDPLDDESQKSLLDRLNGINPRVDRSDVNKTIRELANILGKDFSDRQHVMTAIITTAMELISNVSTVTDKDGSRIVIDLTMYATVEKFIAIWFARLRAAPKGSIDLDNIIDLMGFFRSINEEIGESVEDDDDSLRRESNIDVECRQCHQRNVWHEAKQTRSGDEAVTDFYLCLSCDYNWKD